jgi:hypothetical protein
MLASNQKAAEIDILHQREVETVTVETTRPERNIVGQFLETACGRKMTFHLERRIRSPIG